MWVLRAPVHTTIWRVELVKTFVLDTSVLIHDPNSLTRFQENTVAIPIFVVMELDVLKQSRKHDVAASARQVSRMISDLMLHGDLNTPEGVKTDKYESTFKIIANGGGHGISALEEAENSSKMDRLILSSALSHKQKNPDEKVILISKDINMRILASFEGLEAQDYESDRIDFHTHYRGYRYIDEYDESIVAEAYRPGRKIYSGDLGLDDLFENEFVIFRKGDKIQPFRYYGDTDELSPIPKSFNASGIDPRNIEQRMALTLLTDPSIQLATMVGKAGTGKAQPLDSKVLTPQGWKLMGELQVGDLVCTPDGGSAPITGIFPQGQKEVFEVQFTDGSSTRCCAEHLWLTQTSLERDYSRPGQVRSLAEIRETLRYAKSGKRNHSIPITEPVHFPEKPQPVDPYVMGTLIGDGGFRGSFPTITSADEQIIHRVRQEVDQFGLEVRQSSKYDYRICGDRGTPNPLTDHLRELGLWGKKSEEKHIPKNYLFGSVSQRVALLRGLMDTDGEVEPNGTGLFFSTSSPQLSEDFQFLVQSLGGTAKTQQKKTSYTYKGEKREGLLSFRTTVVLPNEIVPFLLERKKSVCKPRVKYFSRRYIDAVEPVGVEECQCIMVDHPDHLYLTDSCIVTHNTYLALAAALGQACFHRNSHYDRVILSKPVVSMGKDIGFLPGDFDAKMEPWMMSFFDNLDQLMPSDYDSRGKGSNKPERAWEQLIHSGQIEVQAIHSIRGRSIANSFMIVDECFPYDTPVKTEEGPRKIGALFSKWIRGGDLPRVWTFNEWSQKFEWKAITHMWHRGVKPLVEVALSNRKIKCTENHPFLTKRGWVEAGELRSGDLVYADCPDESQILLALNQHQKQLLLGSFLGDGSFEECGVSRTRLKVTHGLPQSEYANWKAQLLGASTKPLKNSGYNPDQDKVQFCTKMLGWDFGELPRPKDHCPQYILDEMDVRALAIWFMDDGSSSYEHYNWARFHTESFDEDSQHRMVLRLRDFGVEAIVSENKGRPHLRLKKESYRKLSEIIAPWVHESMRHKVHPDYQDLVGTKQWNPTFPEFGYVVVKGVSVLDTEDHVFDMEVEDNHNFIVPSTSRGKLAGEGGVVVHNCQNLSPHEIKTIITRASEGTKVVLCGDPFQIDHAFLDVHSNGLMYVTERMKESPMTGSVYFTQGERSPLAEMAATLL